MTCKQETQRQSWLSALVGGGTPGQAPEQRFLGNGLQMRGNVGQLRQPSEQERRADDLPAVESHPGWSGFNI